MTIKDNSARDALLRKLEAFLHSHRLKRARTAQMKTRVRRAHHHARARLVRLLSIRFRRRGSVLRKVGIGLGVSVGLIAIVIGGFWWRLSTGPIDLNIATPWLTSAIEQNFGSKHKIEVGGTVLERDAKGRTALRLRDIVVRDADGELIATAPRAEIGISGKSLLLGNPRVVSFLLVDAAMDVRVDPDGTVNVYAGGNRPFVTISPVGSVSSSASPQIATAPPPDTSPKTLGPLSLSALNDQDVEKNIVALLTWMDGLGSLGQDGKAISVTGFDGHELTEIGVKNGSLTVDDARNNRQWSFTEITLSLTRPAQGGVAFSASSETDAQAWSLTAALHPLRDGRRFLRFDANHVMLDHLLLALRVGDGQFASALPITAEIRAEIGQDGMPLLLKGRVTASGSIGNEKNPEEYMPIDFMEVGLDWDATRRTLLVPMHFVSSGNRLTLFAQATPPQSRDGVMLLSLHGGSIVLGPLAPDRDTLVLKRIAVNIRHDLARKRVDIEQADFGTDDDKNVGLALSGYFDYARDDPQLTLGLAATKMGVPALKRLWPSFVAPRVRTWVTQHVFTGTVDRIDVAINTPVSTFPANGPSMTDDALAIDLGIKGGSLRPVDGLPLLRDADVTVHVTGRTATVRLSRGIVDISPGRRLAVSNGIFDLADMNQPAPPARVRFKLEGSVAAAAELMANEKLRDVSGTPFDPATSRGAVSAQITIMLPLAREVPKSSVNFSVNLDLTNFSAERMMLGQKVEAALLRVAANNQSYQVKGDVKIGGTPAQLEYRKNSGEPDAEVRIQATLDEAARARLGFDLGGAVTGPIPVKVTGRVANDRDTKLMAEADLTAARIENLLPGWVKPPGRSVKATFALVKSDSSTRFDEIAVDGSGVMLRGGIEIDPNNELQSVNFSTFALAEGDKATLKADRTNDGALRVVLRGDVFDGRSFVKSSISGSGNDAKPKPQRDIDLDVKVSRVLGFNGEALRSLDLKMSRRAGQIRGFALNATLGRDSPLRGDLRDVREVRDLRARNGSTMVLLLDTGDAGALLRFTDIYPRMNGGRLSVMMDPPTAERVPQEGIINLRDFSIRNEQELVERVVPQAQDVPRDNVAFTQLNVEFTRTPGKISFRDGVVRGPVIGATIDGTIDFQRDAMQLRGTFVPLYTINTMFKSVPLVNLFVGDGVIGLITYELVGSPNQPILRFNPASALAPGILRKFFEFPAGIENNPAPSPNSFPGAPPSFAPNPAANAARPPSLVPNANPNRTAPMDLGAR